MHDLIEKNKKHIFAICEQHKVRFLFVFGSVLTEDFRDDSDIDFLVEFEEIKNLGYADNYFSLKHSLEDLLGKNVDLLVERSLKNPYLIQELNNTKQILYAA